MGKSEARGAPGGYQVAETEPGDESLDTAEHSRDKKSHMLVVCSMLSILILILTLMLNLAALRFSDLALYLDYSAYCVQGTAGSQGELARELG